MKKATLTLFVVMMTSLLNGQEIKISIAPTVNAGFHYQFVTGNPGQRLKAGVSSSAANYFPTNKKLKIGIVAGYQFSKVEFVPNRNTGEMLLHKENVNLLSLGIISALNFKNSTYISLAPSLDIELAHNSQNILDNQSGIGLTLSFGKYIKLKEDLFFTLEPMLCVHNVVPFSRTNNPYHLTSLGLKLGIVFGKK